MKIIFLDVDGPLIPLRMHIELGIGIFMYEKDGGCYKWDSFAVKNLNKICEETGAKIVFNSTHNDSAEGLLYTAEKNGLKLDHIYQPTFRTGFPTFQNDRFHAIEAWLRAYKMGKMQKHVIWVVIDDIDLKCPRQVMPTLQHGMTEELFEEVRKKLND